MSDVVVASLNTASQNIAIYINLFNLIFGIPGDILIIIIFISLKTLRESTCAFYLTVMSIFNIAQLVFGSLTRFVTSGYNIDWTISSLAFCKIRTYILQVSSLISITCLCLATIDQYFATSTHVRFQQLSNIKYVRITTTIVIIFWMLVGISYLVFYEIIVSHTTGRLACTSWNDGFNQYNTYFHRLMLLGVIPNIITIVFGSLARRNVTQLAYRTVPLIRRELDKQLTTMLLVQVVFNVFALLLYNIIGIIVQRISTNSDPVVAAKIQLVQILSYSVFYLYAACPFYIYVCVSDRFRRQLAHVLIGRHFKECCKARIVVNEVAPTVQA